jgi:hypothetical protein
MSFRDLPSGIRDLPLTDPAIAADVIDLIISDEARASGAIGVMVCDDQDRGLQPVVVSDVPEVAGSTSLAQLLELLLPVVSEERGSVLVGRGRRRGQSPTDADRAWHQQAIDSCGQRGVRLLGFYVATRDGVFAMPEPLGAAAS